MTSDEKKVVLMIADISGYTSFMVANKTSLTHAQVIITENAYKDIKFPHEVKVDKGVEKYGEIGKVKTYVFLEPVEKTHEHRDYSAKSYKVKNAIVKMYNSVLLKLKVKKLRDFRNLPKPESA